jgi:hypothetical protein
MASATITRHWLAHREIWKDMPQVITTCDDAAVAKWRRLGYRIEGPFVLEVERARIEQDIQNDEVRRMQRTGRCPCCGADAR